MRALTTAVPLHPLVRQIISPASCSTLPPSRQSYICNTLSETSHNHSATHSTYHDVAISYHFACGMFK